MSVAAGWEIDVAARARAPGERGPEVPSWAATLRAATSTLADCAGRPPPEAAALPFGRLWTALAEHVRSTLAEHPSAGAPVHAVAVDGFTRWLSSELSSLGLPVLIHAFTRHRNGQAAPSRPGARALHDAFVGRLVDGGLAELLTRQPVWARLIGCRIDHTIAAARRFLDHWAADRDALAERVPEARGALLELTPGLSEPHARGQTVVRLRFADDATIYYKPRPLAGHALLQQLLARVHDAIGDARPPELRALPRADHGWVAHVAHRPAATVREWRAFHRRAGALLFTLYLTGTTDAHADNLIAHGGWPLLIDAECLLHPTLRASLSSTPADDSVARVGLLPRWARDERGLWYSQAGLSDPRRNAPDDRRGGSSASTPTR